MSHAFLRLSSFTCFESKKVKDESRKNAEARAVLKVLTFVRQDLHQCTGTISASGRFRSVVGSRFGSKDDLGAKVAAPVVVEGPRVVVRPGGPHRAFH